MNRPHLIRRLRIAWTVAWGILCVLLVVLWVRSYYVVDHAYAPPFSHTVVVTSRQSGIGFGMESLPNTWGWMKFPPETGGSRKKVFGALGFEYFQQLSHPRVAQIPYYFYAIRFPSLFAIVVSSTIAAAPWIRRTSRFSLRTLLIATTLIAVVLGLVVWAASNATAGAQIAARLKCGLKTNTLIKRAAQSQKEESDPDL